jgi:hypothetical protein
MDDTTVVGCFYDYEYKDLEPWINSLKKTGFNGSVFLVMLSGHEKILNKLTSQGVTVFYGTPNTEGYIDFLPGTNKHNTTSIRFAYLSKILEKNCKTENVVFTDLKDVIFQENPQRLFDSIPYDIIVGEEGFNYSDEPWGKNNLEKAFGGKIYERLKDKDIVCAGVIAGKKKIIIDLFENIYAWCCSSIYPNTVPGGGGPDQAALNIIINQKLIEPYVCRTPLILHAGTSIPGIKAGNGDIGVDVKLNPEKLSFYQYKHTLIDGPICVDGIIKNSFGNRPYYIVHQYDRIPEWKKIIIEKYKD